MSPLSKLIALERCAVFGIAVALGVAATGVHSAPLVDISPVPLYGTQTPHPNVAVTMSVEFPTVGAAFYGVNYVPATEYIGYFEPGKCYTYVDAVGPKPAHFAASSEALAPNHECANKFSGNFMNWLTMSAIDEFRYAMTGGNRVWDPGTNEGAILQRAVLPDYFYDRDANFPIQSKSSAQLATVVPTTVSGTAGTVYAHNCGDKVFFGTSGAGGSCSSPDADRGTYEVRVAVCGPTDIPVRTDLCKNYGTLTAPAYKPVGLAQVNADSVRFAAFGYLMDDSESRYGGVLRAPMRYVGQTKYDANLGPSDNSDKAEVNVDGTLKMDPDKTASSAGGVYSGFINYINKFGSTGVYKRNDPMGEMYYEAIRYYQNLGPTALAADPSPLTALTNEMKDYFPVATPAQWVDPILARCTKNYIINLSDANTHHDKYIPGYNGVPASPNPEVRPASRAKEGGLDAVLWTRKIGVLESDSANGSFPQGYNPGLLGLEDRVASSTSPNDDNSYFAAGAAYWANTQDIRPSLPGKQTVQTFSIDVNEYGGGLDNSRQLYLMGKYGGFKNTIDRSTDTDPNPFFAVNPTNPSGTAIRSNSEWESPPGSNLPAGYLLASSPDRLINGLRDAFAVINTPTGTIGGAAITSANLTLGGAGVFAASFTPTKWSGTVQRHSISVDSTFNTVVSPGPVPANWDAGVSLDARCGTVTAALTTCLDTSTSPDKRNIFTTVRSAGGGRQGAEFTRDTVTGIGADLTYVAALNIPDPTSTSVDNRWVERLNYLRGFRASEGSNNVPTSLRTRDSALGDITNSAPVFVGAPSTNIPDDDYQSFISTNTGRLPAVYVGANDGMLHAFDGSDGATGGKELFAFIPGFSKADLTSLTTPGYQHKTFVDTTPKIQEVKIGTAWKTVLVGANGNGAQGIFALDVTSPVAFNSNKVLFEFSDADDADFGSVLASPEIAKLQVGVNNAGIPTYKYFAVVTTYNNSRPQVNGRDEPTSTVSASSGNKGFLFFLPLDHQADLPWAAGDYYKFSKFDPIDVSKPMGLGPITVLPSKSGDRTAAGFYFGDLQGQLWRFNTTRPASAPTSEGPADWWGASRTSAFIPGKWLPIFNATDPSGAPQPITERPEVSNGPFGSTLVFFGTGKFLGESDQATPPPAYQQQTQYAVVDTTYSLAGGGGYSKPPSDPLAPDTSNLNTSSDSVESSAPTLTRDDLAKRTATLLSGTVNVSGDPFAYTGPGAKRGWFMDFPSTSLGERSINKPAVKTGLLVFDTLTIAGDICGDSGGFIYQLDAVTGTEFTGVAGGYASTVGIPGPPMIVDLQSVAGVGRATGEQIDTRRQTTLVAGSKGSIDTTRDSGKNAVTVTGKVPPIGRVSWREISNWNDKTKH